ncbi:hypothetical protein PSA5_28245, partial [Pseudomonas syringae pv. actinidiae]
LLQTFLSDYSLWPSFRRIRCTLWRINCL